ncbi:MAG: dephospho-CoA kinase [Polyangiaceae bacterium]
MYLFRVHLFGLTGGIASGKSTVAARFREVGLPVIDADLLAREVVSKNSEGLAEVTRELGPSVLTSEGELDRKAVATLVFSDANARAKLNAILHPRISNETAKQAMALAQKGEPLACYEAALLVENGLADAFRPLVVVWVPESVQVARAMVRDGSTEAQARGRLGAQTSLEEKLKAADITIDNSGSLEDARNRADAALRDVCAQLGVDPARYGISG